MTSKALLVCVSKHGNTATVAQALASVLEAEVKAPEEVDHWTLPAYDVVGFGSGIYMGTHDPRLREYVEHLPLGEGRAAFVFTTAGLGRAQSWPGQRSLETILEEKGYRVLGSFACRGFDTWWPLRLVGGLNKGHPDAVDLSHAYEFATRIARELPVRRDSVAG